MTAVDRDTLKTYFETGDRPTQSQFTNLIDSPLVICASEQPALHSSVSLQAASTITFTQTGSVIKFDSVNSGTVGGSGVANELTFWTSSSAISSDPSLTWASSQLSIKGTISISGSKSLGAGNALVNITSIITGNNNATRGLQFAPTWTTATCLADIYGILGTPTASPNNGISITTVTGLYFGISLGSTGSVGTIRGIYIAATGTAGVVPHVAAYGIVIDDISNTGNPLAVSIRLVQPGYATDNYYIDFSVADNTDPTGGGGAAVGRLKVLVGGVSRYLAYY